MSFSQGIFNFGYLPVVIILCLLFVLRKSRVEKYVLIGLSLLFYSWGGVAYLCVALFLVASNYMICRGIEQNKKRLCIGLFVNLGILIGFKYSAFIFQNFAEIFKVCEGGELLAKTALIKQPIGLSFIVFSMISYLVDCYRGETEKNCTKFSDVLLYGLYFPKIMSGPIVRWKDFSKELVQKKATFSDLYMGLRRFCIGFSKKILLGNPVAQVSDVVFGMSDNVNTLYAWIGIIAYTLYIYIDFSSYSDMAIGLAHMMGFKFAENFNYPYISSSIKEFWRRWHISLSTWFRDYVYIPLGGNRLGTMATYRNLLIVFFLTGVWHGASWNFIVWGMYYGIFLIIERVTNFTEKIPRFFAHVYTILVVMIGWVFFRAENLSIALQYIRNMFCVSFTDTYAQRIEMIRLFNAQNIAAFLLAICVSGPFCKKVFVKLPEVLKNVMIIAVFFVSICYMLASDYNPFIYFTF